jgi:hypothetical protein
MSTIGDGSFADRLYEQLLPFQRLDQSLQLWVFCDAYGCMFQPVEDLTTTRDDDLVGYANLIDIDTCPEENLGYLGQYVGVNLRGDLTGDDQRDWVRQKRNFKRGTPQATIDAVKETLTGTKFVALNERIGTAWHYTVVTKPSETPDPALTDRAILAHKPGPDTYNHNQTEYPTYGWVRDTYNLYSDLQAAYPTYGDLTNAEITL